MGKWLFGLAWAFIVAVVAYDTYLAWQYRAALGDWELNPLARWSADRFGVGSVFVKAVVVALALLVAVVCWHRRRRLTTFLYTAVAGGVHLALSLHYVLGYMQPG